MTTRPLAAQRRHTFHFLDEIRTISPVFLDTEVDLTTVLEHRASARTAGQRYSLVSYVLHAAGRALARHPDANAAIRGRWWPRVARYESVHGKLTLDAYLGGQRIVLATVLTDVHRAELAELQGRIDHVRDGDPAGLPEFRGARLLHRLPVPVGRLVYRRVVRPLARRPELFGTFSVTSLGHRPVDGFHSVGGTTVTLGVGRYTDRPVVRDGQVTVAPVLRLNLSFDHRVIDGAEAADLLADIKDNLEKFQEETA